jgi:IQ calmodulin-binding motif
MYNFALYCTHATQIEEAAKAQHRLQQLRTALAAAARGAARRAAREAADRHAAAVRRTSARQEARKREAAARNLQRLYRGYRGRRSAGVWALRRAEADALRSVLLAAAVTVQRVFRGYQGRCAAAEVRMELAEFIIAVRLAEAQSDLTEYWATHTGAKLQDRLLKRAAEGVKRGVTRLRGAAAGAGSGIAAVRSRKLVQQAKGIK